MSVNNKPDLANIQTCPMPPEKAIEELSDIAIRILIGAETYEGQHFNPQLIRLTLGGTEQVIHIDDLYLAKWAADKVYREHIKAKNLKLMVQSIPYLLNIRSFIRKNLIQHFRQEDSKVRVIMLRSDNMGCGYWRIKLPGEFLKNEDNDLIIHITDVSADFDTLSQYDVIVVQRIFDFEQYYVLNTLKSIGKKIVYEVDDDIFNVETHNPSANIYNRFDSQMCMRHCLSLADMVIASTERLSQALGASDKTFVYPNSLDWDKIFHTKAKNTERRKRIFWSGSNTHDQDFKVCMPAILRIFQERDDVELMVIGSVPPLVGHLLKDYKDRVLCLPGMHTEAYFQYLMYACDADVGIIPLENTVFNHSKSVCKGLEYTVARLAIIASGFPPYSDVYTHNKDALLCQTDEDWYKSINLLLENDAMRDEMIKNARKKAVEKFHLRLNANSLGDAIIKLGSDLVANRIEQKNQSQKETPTVQPA